MLTSLTQNNTQKGIECKVKYTLYIIFTNLHYDWVERLNERYFEAVKAMKMQSRAKRKQNEFSYRLGVYEVYGAGQMGAQLD